MWKVFDGEGYTINEGAEGFDRPFDALQAALDRGYDLQRMIDEGYTIALVLEDEYTWLEVLDETTVGTTAAFMQAHKIGRCRECLN